MARMMKSRHHDGVDPNWFHFDCFWPKAKGWGLNAGELEKIKGVEAFRIKDQGVYQNTGQGHPENFSYFALMAVFRANVMKIRFSTALDQKPSSRRKDCINVGSGIMNYVFVDQCKSLCLWWRVCIK